MSFGFNVIGQVRRDTALFGFPVVSGKKGRPCKYGKRFDADAVAALPETREWVFLYGKWQWVRYRSAACLARFMEGRPVCAIWMQFEDELGKLIKQRVILSTMADLMPQQIFAYYGRRWSIEDLFNQMKNRWGWKDAWQQSRLVLNRWTQILSVSYSLPRLLATFCVDQVEAVMLMTPWRKKSQITAGRVRLGLNTILGKVQVRAWWDPKCRKFQPPLQVQPPPTHYYPLALGLTVINHPPPS